MIVGDSGSGKSSLAKAGLAYRFRGGALEDLSGTVPGTRVWHVIETRPLATPFAKLADNVAELAGQLGRSAADQENYRERIRSRDAQRVRDALKDASPPGAEILLLVDQFEELFTLPARAGWGPGQRGPGVCPEALGCQRRVSVAPAINHSPRRPYAENPQSSESIETPGC
jgi:hypothetical protein